MPFVCLVTPSPNRRHTERGWSHFRSRWHLLATEPEGLSPSSVCAHRCYDCWYLVIVMAVCTNWLQVDHKKGSADFWDEFAGALAWHSMHSIRMVSRWHVWMGHSGPMMARIGIYADQSQLLCSCGILLKSFEYLWIHLQGLSNTCWAVAALQFGTQFHQCTPTARPNLPPRILHAMKASSHRGCRVRSLRTEIHKDCSFQCDQAIRDISVVFYPCLQLIQLPYSGLHFPPKFLAGSMPSMPVLLWL